MIRRIATVALFAVGFVIISIFIGIRDSKAEVVGNGFTITPPVFELKANPGDTLEEVVSLYNNGDGDLEIAITSENLKPMGEKGQVQIVGSDDNSLPALKDWINAPENSFILKKGMTKNISFSIKVPGNAEPGGHFASILFGTVSGENGAVNGSIVSQKLGSLLFLTVAGEAKEDAKIIEFMPQKKFHLKNEQIDFNLRIKNEGNVYVRPRGFLVITDILGRKIEQIEIDGKNILPDATREIPISYQSKKLFGPYTATLTLVYGTTNLNLNSSSGFIIIPWVSTLSILIGIILLILLRKRLWQALLILIGKKN